MSPMTATLEQSAGFSKPPTTAARYAVAYRILPPMVDKNDVPYCKYVTPRGIIKTYQCTRRMFEKILGRALERRPHTGLDHQTHSRFLLKIDEKKTVIGVDMYGYQEVLHRLDLVQKDPRFETALVADFDAETGDITISGYPQNTPEQAIHQLLADIDRDANITVGKEFGRFVVSGIDGRQVLFELKGGASAPIVANDDDVFRTARGQDVIDEG